MIITGKETGRQTGERGHRFSFHASVCCLNCNTLCTYYFVVIFLRLTVHGCSGHYPSVFYPPVFRFGLFREACLQIFSAAPHLPSIPPGVFLISGVHLQMFQEDPFPSSLSLPCSCVPPPSRRAEESKTSYFNYLGNSRQSQHGNHCIHSLCFLQGLTSVSSRPFFMYVFNKCLLID